MSQNLERRAGQLALYEARSLKQYPNIVESARWLARNHQESLQREQTFTYIIETINITQNYAGAFRDVGKLKILIENEQLPTLGQIIKQGNETLCQTVQEAKQKYPEWADKKFRAKGTPVWSMIIEGYGMYLGKKYGEENEDKRQEINRTFVLAFEAVAFTNYRDSALVSDVIDWMREEKNDFPSDIATQL
ncbi:MAG: hypothetical protein M1268_01240 [Patescibacteria group bacterium]|nr:hypothetical protein [Patescibacteria group bacterium]